MQDYIIITKHQVFAEERDAEDENYADALFEEQQEKLKVLGFHGGFYVCHFFDSLWFNDALRAMTIEDAIQCLAIKDGVDLVQFENGSYGFVAYYNGDKNGFEVIR